MNERIKKFLQDKNSYNVAIFISGTGSNADKILSKYSSDKKWVPKVIVTDNPQTSKAIEISKKYNIPIITNDIKYFYKKNGLDSISLSIPHSLEIREEWTDELRIALRPFLIDFGILAGFIPLTNLTGDFPCLNIHPGDLTVIENGQRKFIGLHTTPIEKAIISGMEYLRSSVIIAEPYGISIKNMDSGYILGISEKIPINYLNFGKHYFSKGENSKSQHEFKQNLRKTAEINLSNLKENGDWVIFSEIIDDFSQDKFAYNQCKQLFFYQKHMFLPINTIIYKKNGEKAICN